LICGTALATCGRRAISSASAGCSPLPPRPDQSGRTTRRLVPSASIRLSTSRSAPSPNASMVTTEPTPMTMPSRVSTVRNRLTRSERMAMRTASMRSNATPGPAPACLRSAARCRGALEGAGCSSATITPSAI
jgi:hypothetical protein